MALDSGFIFLHRKITKWEWYDDLNTFRLFLHLLLTVNYEPAQWRGVTIGKGQRVTSLSKLAKETGLSVKSVRTSLNRLKSTNEVACESTSQYTILTIVNYSKYQDWEDFTASAGHANGQSNGKRAASEGQQRNKNNKNNKENNINPPIIPLDKPKLEPKPKAEKTSYAEFVSLTNAEYEALVAKIGKAGADRCVEILDNYKGSTGKKYSSDYRTILNWVINRYQKEVENNSYGAGNTGTGGAPPIPKRQIGKKL